MYLYKLVYLLQFNNYHQALSSFRQCLFEQNDLTKLNTFQFIAVLIYHIVSYSFTIKENHRSGKLSDYSINIKII
jgi:hypothetical protein